MARGPRREWRPDDVVGYPVHVGKIVRGQIEDTKDERFKKDEDKEEPAEAAE